uniref:DNA polymerase alpha subunit B n=1 Tax=Lepisosteus oculatus TaxID=7918 RepID=W5M4I8_LEPOC
MCGNLIELVIFHLNRALSQGFYTLWVKKKRQLETFSGRGVMGSIGFRALCSAYFLPPSRISQAPSVPLTSPACARSYYPLYPPAVDVNLDYEHFQSHGQMPVTPDVLIVPSDLRYFVKDVIGCVCVNPGRLTKGQVGGTYGRLLVQRGPPLAGGERRSPCLSGQVVKI